MKHTLKIASLVLAASLTFGTTAALADEFMSGGHPYIGVGAGYGNIISPAAMTLANSLNPLLPLNNTMNANQQHGGLASAVNLGYLWYTQPAAFGAEVSYNVFPISKYTIVSSDTSGTASYNASSFNIMAVGKYFLLPEFNVLAKAGMAYSMQSLEQSGNSVSYPHGTTGSISHNSWQPAIAAGIAYEATQNVELNLTGNYIWGNRENVPNHDFPEQPLASLLATVNYNF